MSTYVEREIEYKGDGSAEHVLEWALSTFHPHISLACSFSIEDTVVIDMMKKILPDARVFAIDTGRLNEETYECAEKICRHYNLQVEWYFPKNESVENLLKTKGLYSFRENLENRHECCGIRKVEPLSRALSGLKAWITGLRREQSQTRAAFSIVEKDVVHGGIIKINPLADWTSDQVWNYIRKHKLPYNSLYDRNYLSIGCEPCTRAVQPGEHPRAGRWWWELPEHKECGLHVRNWTI